MDFKRNKRLTNAKDYTRVFESNLFRASNKNLLALAIDNAPHPTSRLGVVVSKKNVRRAVDRNKIKRLIRERFRQDAAHLSQHVDVVVLARTNTNTLTNTDINSALKSILKSVFNKAQNERSKKIIILQAAAQTARRGRVLRARRYCYCCLFIPTI